jgi:hypothetical protein
MKACCVCLTDIAAEEMWLLLPCGHRCVCEGCAAALLSTTRKCPKCRVRLERTMRVFEEGDSA